MRWVEAEKALRAGRSIRRKGWAESSIVRMFKGHVVRSRLWGNATQRKWFKVSNAVREARDWEVAI